MSKEKEIRYIKSDLSTVKGRMHSNNVGTTTLPDNYKTAVFVDRTLITRDQGQVQPVIQPSLKPTRIIYKIDDCFITRDVEKVDIVETYKDVKDLFGKAFPEYVNSYSGIIDKKVPVITQEVYLRELKDAVLKGLEHNLNKLSRLFLKTSDDTKVGNVIIINRYKNKYILLNEVYKNNVFQKAVEYDIEDILKIYKDIEARNVLNN